MTKNPRKLVPCKLCTEQTRDPEGICAGCRRLRDLGRLVDTLQAAKPEQEPTQTAADPLTFAQKVDLLFQHGKALGLAVTYRAIAAATGENANNIRKIHVGTNANPGIRLVDRLARYFRVSLAFFACKTLDECLAFLQRAERVEQSQAVALRAAELSPEGLEAVTAMIDHIRKIECGERKES